MHRRWRSRAREAENDLKLEWEYRTGDPDLDERAAQLRKRRESIETEARQLAELT